MLSAYQAATAAFIGEGVAYHPDCVPAGADVEAISRYSVAAEWPEGLECDACYEYIEEPDPEYCLNHYEWAEYYTDENQPHRCSRGDDSCRFYGEGA